MSLWPKEKKRGKREAPKGAKRKILCAGSAPTAPLREKKQKKNSDSAREKNLRRKFGQFGNNRYLCSRNKNNNDDGNNCKKKDNYSRKGKEEDIGV